MWGEKQLFWLIDTPPFTASGSLLHSFNTAVVDTGFCMLSRRGASRVAERIHGRNVQPARQEHMVHSGQFRGIFGVFLGGYCDMMRAGVG
jgi:hypothetical protein